MDTRSPVLHSTMAAGALADILTAPAFDKIWRRHYASRPHQPGFLAAEFRKHADNISARPDLVSFGRNLIRTERRALGKEENVSALQSNLGVLEDYFATLEPSQPLKKPLKTRARDFITGIPGKARDVMNASVLALELREPGILKELIPGLRSRKKPSPEEEARHDTMERILHVLEKETVTAPFTPVRSSWTFLKKWAKHFVEEIGEHKVSNGILFTLAVGMYRFMIMRLPPAATVRLTPEETAMTGISLDSLDQNTTLAFDPSLMRTSLPQSCHDHLKQLTGSEAVADFARDKLTIGGVHLFPQDCFKMNMFAANAQSNMLTGYNWMNERLNYFIVDRVTDVTKTLPENSAFVATFNRVAFETAHYVNIFDNIENITFHGGLLITSFIMAHKLNSMNHEEAREKWNSIKDFFKRTARNNYLNYAFAIAAGGAYVASGAPQASVMAFWSGLAGCALGQSWHKYMRKGNRERHVEQLTASIREKLDAFRETAAEIGEAPSEKSSKFNTTKKLAVAFAAAATLGIATYAGLDHAQTVELTATVLARMAVIGTYLFINVPQDTFLHVIFAIIGGSAGCITGSAEKKIKKAIDDYRERMVPA
jgi:hypothetical protein